MCISYVNLTPHPVVLYPVYGPIQTFPPQDRPLRLRERQVDYHEDGPIVTSLLNLFLSEVPPKKEDTVYIASMPYCMALSGAGLSDRTDIVYPIDQVRDDKGRILGCRGFATISAVTASLDCNV